MKNWKKALCILLTLVLVLTSVSVAAAQPANDAETPVAELQLELMSDTHIYPHSMTGGDSEEWIRFCTGKGKEFEQSEAIVDAALDSVEKRAAENGTKYLLLSGDLTKDGEYQAHKEFAEKLLAFEARTGIDVIVTNGNHDINNWDACDFSTGTQVPARQTTQHDFYELYQDLGFDLADDFYNDAFEGQGGLSYSVPLDDAYELIVIDSNLYLPKWETGGRVEDALMDWIVSRAEAAYADGRTPIAMMHHSVGAHMDVEPSITFAFCVEEYRHVAETMADAGIHYVFTGHQHTNDITSIVSDSGNVIYDCEVGATTGYPNKVREAKFTTFADGESKCDFDLLPCDYAHPVINGDTVYPVPFSASSFAINFGGALSENGYASTAEFLMGIVDDYGGRYIDRIREAGGIAAFLKTMDIDLEQIIGNFLAPYIGSGLKIAGKNVFSTENIMWFLNDLLSQVDALYINDPDAFHDFLAPIVDDLMRFPVSDVPCTKYIDTLHFGDANAPGTMGDLVLTAMAGWFDGDEVISDDPFAQDVLDNLANGDLGQRIIEKLIDVIYNTILKAGILEKLQVNLDKLFEPSGAIIKRIGMTLQEFVNRVLHGENTYMNLVNTFFGLNALPYTDLYDILDKEFIQEYMTDSQWETIGLEIADILDDFLTDTNPVEKGDDVATYYTYSVAPEVTQANYRLPSMLSLTLGESPDSAYITWFSKETVKGCDIELYQADDPSEVTFTGEDAAPANVAVMKTSAVQDREYPGIDFGVIGFFKYTIHLNKHVVTLSQLEPGQTYVYRVGDAEKGWWSETGVFHTPDGSKNVTFLHVSDPQSGTRGQYERTWANVLRAALAESPDADFILNTGDLVDNGSNVDLWQWMFDSASDSLRNVFHMPVTGNHEAIMKSVFATTDNFTLPNVPEQDNSTGVYYSFDYNNVHVTILNTNDLDEDDGLTDSQLDWLKADLAASSADWKFVAFHKAVYSNGSHFDDDDVCAIREQLVDLMPALDVDVVFQGHDHIYLRTYSMKGNKVVNSDRVYLEREGQTYIADVTPTGTTYVISGTAGVKTYMAKPLTATDPYFPRPEKAPVVTKSMYAVIHIEDGVLYFDANAVNEDGTTEDVDCFAIQKDPNQGNVTGKAPSVKAIEHRNGFSNFITKLKKFFSTVRTVFSAIFKVMRLAVGS